MREAVTPAPATIPMNCRTATPPSSTRWWPSLPKACCWLCTRAAATSRAPHAAAGNYEPGGPLPSAEMNLTRSSEYDDDRSGDFKPLRHLPKGKTVVLGLVTTKFGAWRASDALKRRIEEAAKYAPMEQLALSCNAASPARCMATTSPWKTSATSCAWSWKPRRRDGARRNSCPRAWSVALTDSDHLAVRLFLPLLRIEAGATPWLRGGMACHVAGPVPGLAAAHVGHSHAPHTPHTRAHSHTRTRRRNRHTTRTPRAHTHARRE